MGFEVDACGLAVGGGTEMGGGIGIKGWEAGGALRAGSPAATCGTKLGKMAVVAPGEKGR